MAGIDKYTKLMLHCDGADESQTFTDSSFTPHTVTAVGTAQIDTAKKKFGSGAGLFDGNSDYLTIPDHADWDFNSGDWTIDCWVYSGNVTAGNAIIYGQYTDNTNRVWVLLDENNIRLDVATLSLSLTGAHGLSNNTWAHLAFVRYGNEWDLYVGGVSKANTTETGDYPNIASVVSIGIGYYSGTPYYFGGHIDEFRISKGIARWTSNFTPPTQSYSKIAGGFSGFSPWIFMKDMWEEHNKIFRPNKKILIPQGI